MRDLFANRIEKGEFRETRENFSSVTKGENSLECYHDQYEYSAGRGKPATLGKAQVSPGRRHNLVTHEI